MLDKPSKVMTPAESGLLDQLYQSLEGLTAGRLLHEKQKVLDQFEREGFPGKANEAWRYTDLRKFITERGETASKQKSDEVAARGRADLLFGGNPGAVLTFINGELCPFLSHNLESSPYLALAPLEALVDCDGKGDEIMDFGEWDGDPLIGLNLALTKKSLAIHLKNDTKKDVTIRIRNISTGEAHTNAFRRLAIWVLADSKISVVETFEGAEDVAYQINQVCKIHVHRGAELKHAIVQTDGRSAVHIGSVAATVEKNATYSLHPILFGAAMHRLQIGVALPGEGSHFELVGGTCAAGDQHHDVTVKVDHIAPNCTSNERYKLVLADQAQGVFQGKIRVQRPAQKTEAELMGRALMLSDRAKFRGKPELEIFADDVVCGHGITSAALDPVEIYYLRSRGISLPAAQAILIEAFLAEILDELPLEIVTDCLRERLRNWAHSRINV